MCKNRAKLCCDNCVSPDQTIQRQSVDYCTEKCRASDSTDHEKLCTSRQEINKLYRIAVLLQFIFFTLRENTFDRRVIHVENKDDRCAIYVENAPYNLVFCSLPPSVLRCRELKAVVLAYYNCDWSVEFMWNILSLLVKGL